MKDGGYIKYYKSGDIKYKINFTDGKRHGEFISLCENGEIFYKYYYIYDKVVTELGWFCYNRNIKLELLGL